MITMSKSLLRIVESSLRTAGKTGLQSSHIRVRFTPVQCAHYSNRSVDINNRYPYNPNLGDELPEHVHAEVAQRQRVRVYTWGVAVQGALGRASFLAPKLKKHRIIEFYSNPHRMEFGEKNIIIDASCGYGFTLLAIKDKDKTSCFGTGLNTDGQLGVHMSRNRRRFDILTSPQPIQMPLTNDERVVKVSCGRAHSSVLTNKNNVYCFGNNIYGQCGRPVIANENYAAITNFNLIEPLREKVQQIESGQDTSFFLTSNGEVFSCGWGADGQTGRGHYKSESKVGQVEGDIKGEKIVKISSRADCALALSESGEVFGWGNNEYQQLLGVTAEPQLHTPKHLKLPSAVGRVTDIACGGTACYLVNERGELYSWGYGPLGRGPQNLFSNTPEVIPSTLLGNTKFRPDTKVSSVSCGVHMTMCITDRGDIYSWGKNKGGSLGQGHTKQQDYPVKVNLPCRAVAVSCGVDHALALAKQF